MGEKLIESRILLMASRSLNKEVAAELDIEDPANAKEILTGKLLNGKGEKVVKDEETRNA